MAVDYTDDSGHQLTFDDLYPVPNDSDLYVIYQFDDSNADIGGPCVNGTKMHQCTAIKFQLFNQTSPLVVQTDVAPVNNSQHLHSWSLYNLIKIQSNGWVLLGDMAKYVPLSAQRFQKIEVTTDGMNVVVNGAPNESIVVTFLTQEKTILKISVNFNENGDSQTISVSNNKFYIY